MSGPGGSILCTSDAPLSLRKMAGSDNPTACQDAEPLMTERPPLITETSSAAGAGISMPSIVVIDASVGGPTLQLPFAAAMDADAPSLSAASLSSGLHGGGGGLLDALMGGSALMGGLAIGEGGPMAATQPRGSLVSIISDIGATAAHVRVPEAFMLPAAAKLPSPQLCILCPPGCSGGGGDPPDSSTSSTASGAPQSPHSGSTTCTACTACVDLALLPRPDLLCCWRDLVVVGSSCGPSVVQLFWIRTASASGGGGVLLQPLTHLALCTPTLEPTACRLRGLVLASLTPEGGGSGAVSGAADSKSPPTRVQLMALLGGHQAGGQAPAFISMGRAGPGGVSRLAPLLLCTFRDPCLTTASASDGAATPEAASPPRRSPAADTVDLSPAAGPPLGGAPLPHESVGAIAELMQGMERRMGLRMERMEGLLVQLLGRVQGLEERLTKME